MYRQNICFAQYLIFISSLSPSVHCSELVEVHYEIDTFERHRAQLLPQTCILFKFEIFFFGQRVWFRSERRAIQWL